MLSPNHTAALAKSVTAILHAVAGEEYAAIHGKSIPGSVDCLLQVSSAIHRAVDGAIAVFNEGWNAAHCDPVLRLPHELAVECMSYLDFGERILVSHVSHAWRAMMLSESLLWTDLRMSPEPLKSGMDALVTLLDRSAPLPVIFRMVDVMALSRAIMGDAIAVLLHNIDRIEVLELSDLPGDVLAELLGQDTMGLWLNRLLFVPNGKAAVTGGRSPPPPSPITQPARLRLLNSLWELTSYITDVEPFDLRPVWNLCPFLRVLEVDALAGSTLDRLHILHAPQSLSVIRLNAHRDAGRPVNYDAFLRSCAHRTIREIHLGSAAGASDALQLFAQMTAGRWSLAFDGLREVVAAGLDAPRSCTITVYTGFNPRSDNSFLHSLSLLAELSLQLWHLIAIARLDSWPRRLPSLRVLSVTISAFDVQRAGDVGYLSWAEAVVITCPALASLTVVMLPPEEAAQCRNWEECAAWTTAYASRILCGVLSSPDTIDRVTLEIAQPECLIDIDLTSLRSLGRTFVIRNQLTGEETVLSADAGPACPPSAAVLAASGV